MLRYVSHALLPWAAREAKEDRAAKGPKSGGAQSSRYDSLDRRCTLISRVQTPNSSLSVRPVVALALFRPRAGSAAARIDSNKTVQAATAMLLIAGALLGLGTFSLWVLFVVHEDGERGTACLGP